VREWKVPFNIRIGRRELPVGVASVTLVLLSVALMNLLTKQVATISGILFTAAFFILFTVSERINRRRLDLSVATLDRFNLAYEQDVTLNTIRTRPGNVLVAVRDYNTLSHLDYALGKTNTEDQDIVVMTIRLVTGSDGGERHLYEEGLFTEYEQRLFTRVVGLAEKHGKPVDLAVVPANDIFDAVAQTALRLDSAEIVAGLSSKMDAQEQARQIGRSWERLPEKPRRKVRFKVVDEENQEDVFYLGAHAPNLTEDDVNLIHKIWLQVSKIPSRRRVHHRDVVRVALIRLERDLKSQSDVMLDFYKIEHKEEEKGREQTGSSREKK
jgi:hypothetical protein